MAFSRFDGAQRASLKARGPSAALEREGPSISMQQATRRRGLGLIDIRLMILRRSIRIMGPARARA
ncbi:hypothetical protein CQW49_20425 [Methylosinus trichosporium OB3b]|uniref:Uncharacterized protein n=1 Tax=Methylosinus trichosporium (strain ATCC 35070 / NCIMB 11131 / UNIQEM 75 / OB3b) TaxID=595536 RepID=A0A2D2D4U7_METT3|nr:hypothetical protein CQW49_20425 [Methylosinus trichosporium OB3b]OBS50355.1 hypothetical protein A8B73_21920 [Methylosinus sp. 3S-1]